MCSLYYFYSQIFFHTSMPSTSQTFIQTSFQCMLIDRHIMLELLQKTASSFIELTAFTVSRLPSFSPIASGIRKHSIIHATIYTLQGIELLLNNHLSLIISECPLYPSPLINILLYKYVISRTKDWQYEK